VSSKSSPGIYNKHASWIEARHRALTETLWGFWRSCCVYMYLAKKKIHFETPLGWYCTIVQSVGTRTFPCQRLPPHINTLPFGHANSQFLASEKVPAVSHSFKPGWSSWLRPISMWHRRLERLDVVVATCHRGHGDTMIAILSTQSYDVPAICLSTVAAVDNNTMTIHWASLVIRTLGRSTTVWR